GDYSQRAGCVPWQMYDGQTGRDLSIFADRGELVGLELRRETAGRGKVLAPHHGGGGLGRVVDLRGMRVFDGSRKQVGVTDMVVMEMAVHDDIDVVRRYS